MKRIVDRGMQAIETLLAIALAVMVTLVFTNVVLRYAFKSGIAVAEEVSRYCFVWLIFLGAIVAMREHAHLGVDSLVRRLPPAGKKICLLLSHVLMLAGCVIIFLGSWNHMIYGAANRSPVSGIPLSWVNAAGVVASAAIGVMLLVDIVRLVSGRLEEKELVQVADDGGTGT